MLSRSSCRLAHSMDDLYDLEDFELPDLYPIQKKISAKETRIKKDKPTKEHRLKYKPYIKATHKKKCPKCSKIMCMSSLKIHLLEQHSSNVQAYKCYIASCNHHSLRLHDVQRHLTNTHKISMTKARHICESEVKLQTFTRPEWESIKKRIALKKKNIFKKPSPCRNKTLLDMLKVPKVVLKKIDSHTEKNCSSSSRASCTMTENHVSSSQADHVHVEPTNTLNIGSKNEEMKKSQDSTTVLLVTGNPSNHEDDDDLSGEHRTIMTAVKPEPHDPDSIGYLNSLQTNEIDAMAPIVRSEYSVDLTTVDLSGEQTAIKAEPHDPDSIGYSNSLPTNEAHTLAPIVKCENSVDLTTVDLSGEHRTIMTAVKQEPHDPDSIGFSNMLPTNHANGIDALAPIVKCENSVDLTTIEQDQLNHSIFRQEIKQESTCNVETFTDKDRLNMDKAASRNSNASPSASNHNIDSGNAPIAQVADPSDVQYISSTTDLHCHDNQFGLPGHLKNDALPLISSMGMTLKLIKDEDQCEVARARVETLAADLKAMKQHMKQHVKTWNHLIGITQVLHDEAVHQSHLLQMTELKSQYEQKVQNLEKKNDDLMNRGADSPTF